MRYRIFFFMFLGGGLAASWSKAEMTIAATAPQIQYSDCVSVQRSGPSVFFSRINIEHKKNYNLDTPGARMRFRCNAKALSVELYYEERDNPIREQNDIGVFMIDDVEREGWIFHRADCTNRHPETVTVILPADGKMHDYELLMPYAARVRVNSITCSDDAVFADPTPRPLFKCVFFGDSVTHGFTASRVDRGYPFRVGQLKNWQVLNLGIGGIAFDPDMAEPLAAIPMDKLVVALGANDWQAGTCPEDVRRNAEALLLRFRAIKPTVPITVITPLWVPSSWHPAHAKYDIALYRQAIVQAVHNTSLKNITIINGPDLIDHNPKLFDRIAVHPNDAGFAQMALRMAEQL